MAYKLKEGDIVIATDNISHLHDLYPEWYPAVGTIGKVQNVTKNDITDIYVKWSDGSTSADDTWHVTDNCIRKVTKREKLLFVKYYDKYMQTTTTSIKQYYKRPSKAKQSTEERLLDTMKFLGGHDYKVIGGNAQYFIAAYMVGKILRVHTSSRLVRIDTVFAKELSDKRKEELETLQTLVNDAMADIMRGDD